jgi:hypothetical protein
MDPDSHRTQSALRMRLRLDEPWIGRMTPSKAYLVETRLG